jgi:hypothetical protein
MSQDKDRSVLEIVKEVKQDILYADEFVHEVCSSFKEHIRYDDKDYNEKNNIEYQDQVFNKNLVHEKINELEKAFTQEYSEKFEPYMIALNDIEDTLSNNKNGGGGFAGVMSTLKRPISLTVKTNKTCRKVVSRNVPQPYSTSAFQMPIKNSSSVNQVLYVPQPNTISSYQRPVNNSIINVQNVNNSQLLNSERNMYNDSNVDCSLIDDELIMYVGEIIDDTYELLGERNMSLVRRIISLFYDVDLMEEAINKVTQVIIVGGGKVNNRRKLKKNGGSVGEAIVGKSMEFVMGQLKGMLTKKTKEVYEKTKTKYSKKSTNENSNKEKEIKDGDENEKWFTKFFKQSAQLTNLNQDDVDREYKKIVEAYNQQTVGKIINDFKGYPFFSQPFYVRSFLWRLLLKGCFGRRYMMFGEHKGFIFDKSVFYRTESKSEECTRRKEEIQTERKNLPEIVKNLGEDADLLYGFADEQKPISKLIWKKRQQMLLKSQKVAPDFTKSQEFALKQLDYDLIKRYAKVVVDCEIMHPLKQKPKEEINSKWKANEDEDKKRGLVIAENALNRSGNEELVKDVKELAKQKEQMESTNGKVNATKNSSQAMDPEKVVSGIKDKIYDTIKDLFVDMSGHILKTLSLNGLNINFGLKIIAQQFMEILLQVLPGPLINIASALGAFPVGIVELGLGLLIMIVVHSYSYYKQRADMLKAKLNTLNQQSQGNSQSTPVVPFDSSNVGYKVINKKSTSIVFPNSTSSSVEMTSGFVLFKYENPLFTEELETLVNQSEYIFEDERLANINTEEITSNDLVEYFLQQPDKNMQGGKKKKVLSKKQHNEISEFLQKYTSKQLNIYLQSKSISHISSKRDKQDIINTIIAARFIVRKK